MFKLITGTTRTCAFLHFSLSSLRSSLLVRKKWHSTYPPLHYFRYTAITLHTHTHTYSSSIVDCLTFRVPATFDRYFQVAFVASRKPQPQPRLICRENIARKLRIAHGEGEEDAYTEWPKMGNGGGGGFSKCGVGCGREVNVRWYAQVFHEDRHIFRKFYSLTDD